jgi:ABC-2 type transport system permease protein
MWGKIRTIAGTNIYITYTDVGALFFILALPVLLSVIIGLAFGEGDNTVELGTAQLAIINQDETVNVGGGDSGAPQRDVNWGQQMYVDVLIENVSPDLAELIDASIATDIEDARQQVEDGDLDAVLIIPPEFTTNVLEPDAQGDVELYYNPGNEVTVTVLVSVIEQLTAQINTGESAQDILVESDEPYLISTGSSRGQSSEQIAAAAGDVLQQLFSQGAPNVVTLSSVDIEGDARSFDSLSYFAPSMAILFMTFAMANGMRSILEENRNWTMQRLLTTPTPRWAYMAGKMLGTFAGGVVQMVLLIFIMMGVAFLLGRDATIWGNNIFGLALVVITVVAAASALGLLLTAFSSSVRQADNISNAVLIVMAMIGGSFVSIEGNEALDLLSNLSLNKWGIEGFVELADGGGLVDIVPSLLALSAMTILFFGGALFAFSQRDDL